MRALRYAVEMAPGELGELAWRWRRRIGLAALAAVLLGLLASFLVEPRYHSYVSILPQKGFLKEQQIVLGHGDLTDALQLKPMTASNSQNLVVATSFTVREAIVDSLGLAAFFGCEDPDAELARQQAAEALRRATHFELSMYRDVLFIHVTTKDARMSAAIADLYVRLIEEENLNRYHRQSQAMIRYLEIQLADVRSRIDALSDSTAHYYRNKGLVDIENEQQQLFSLLRELEMQALALDLALAREQLDRREDDPRVQQLAQQSRIYREMLAKLEPGGAGPSPMRSAELDMGTVIQAQRLDQELANLEELESDLRTQLAGVVMESEREEASLPLLDRAVIASKPVWPKRWLMVLGPGILAPILVYLLALLIAASRAVRSATGGA